MIYAIVSHPVQDYSAWKPVFDSDAARCEAAGVKILNLLRGDENPNLVTIVASAPSKEAFHGFFSDPILGQKMQQAGVLAPPSVDLYQSA